MTSAWRPRLRQVVEADVQLSGDTVHAPIDELVAWSCVSVAEAQATLDQLAAAMLAQHVQAVIDAKVSAWLRGLVAVVRWQC